jgi:hypothetical protein
MSIDSAKQSLKEEQTQLLKQAAKIGKAIELLQNGSEVQQIEVSPKKRKLSAAGRRAIQEGARKYWASKRKAPTSGKGS